MVKKRVFQDAWNLLFFSIIAFSVAATLNWRNSVWSYWINFATLGVADTGLIFFVLVPGYAPVWPSILGPGILGASDDFLDGRPTAGRKRATPRDNCGSASI